MDAYGCLAGSLEKKNHLRVEFELTKIREEWSIELEMWESPGMRPVIPGAMPKKQVYSAVMPIVSSELWTS
jgi:hypothetical protein